MRLLVLSSVFSVASCDLLCRSGLGPVSVQSAVRLSNLIRDPSRRLLQRQAIGSQLRGRSEVEVEGEAGHVRAGVTKAESVVADRAVNVLRLPAWTLGV